MNSICSNQSRGWICVRAQHLENNYDRSNAQAKKKNANSIAATVTANWCSDADDWGDESFDDDGGFDKTIVTCNQMQLVAQQPSYADNLNEENGNTVPNNVVLMKQEGRNQSEDEDESNSMDDPISMFGNLQVIDDKNANCGEQGKIKCSTEAYGIVVASEKFQIFVFVFVFAVRP